MAEKNGKLIIISGPSGVGKGAIISKLFTDQSLNLAYSVSYTTREQRSQEVDGKNYFFVSKKKFEKMIKNNKFLEYTNFINNYYGTSKTYICGLLKKGYNVILEIEVDGANQILKKWQIANNIVSIFIMPPSYQELETRIRNRASESNEIIEQRLKKAKEEFKVQHQYQFVVINDSISDAVKEITLIINKLIKK